MQAGTARAYINQTYDQSKRALLAGISKRERSRLMRMGRCTEHVMRIFGCISQDYDMHAGFMISVEDAKLFVRGRLELEVSGTCFCC